MISLFFGNSHQLRVCPEYEHIGEKMQNFLHQTFGAYLNTCLPPFQSREGLRFLSVESYDPLVLIPVF